ncbi:MAG: sugar transferase [Chloroflexota bacterium]
MYHEQISKKGFFIEPAQKPSGLKFVDRVIKRLFDIAIALIGLVGTSWLILFAYILATIDTRQSGFFTQTRIGRHGKPFRTIKIRTMRKVAQVKTTVTTSQDPRITRLGRFWRRTKIDELPQLINVLLGQMSLVGPRPDVPGFADRLVGPDRIILSIRPGITGPATLVFRNEEELLAQQEEPVRYNREVIYPEKVRLNREYIENYRLWDDFRCLMQTVWN